VVDWAPLIEVICSWLVSLSHKYYRGHRAWFKLAQTIQIPRFCDGYCLQPYFPPEPKNFGFLQATMRTTYLLLAHTICICSNTLACMAVCMCITDVDKRKCSELASANCRNFTQFCCRVDELDAVNRQRYRQHDVRYNRWRKVERRTVIIRTHRGRQTLQLVASLPPSHSASGPRGQLRRRRLVVRRCARSPATRVMTGPS